MTYDNRAIRNQFPIFAPRGGEAPVHYLDTAATAQIPRRVIETVSRLESEKRANVRRGVHRLAELATESFDQARETVAQYLNAGDTSEVIFTANTTDSINLVARSFGDGLQEGDEIVLSQAEHHGNLVPWLMLKERRGIALKFLPLQKNGRIDLSDLEATITERCKLIAITHASNVTGAITDIAPLITAARAMGAKVLVDGAQMAPHGPLDVQSLGVDFYAFSGHKCFGPTGIGVLWGRKDLLEALPPHKGGGGMIARVTLEKATFAPPPERFEAGTPPIAQAIGMAESLRWIRELDPIALEDHYKALMSETLTELEAMPGIGIIGPVDLRNRLPVISFTMEGAHPHDICQILDSHHVAARGGHHCAQPLMDYFDIQGTTRISFAPYNDRTDIHALLRGLGRAAEILK